MVNSILGDDGDPEEETDAYRRIRRMTDGVLRWYLNDKDVPCYLLNMRDKSPMIDLIELLYWGYFGVKYKSLETLKRGGDGYEKVQVQSTDEDLVINIEYV